MLSKLTFFHSGLTSRNYRTSTPQYALIVATALLTCSVAGPLQAQIGSGVKDSTPTTDTDVSSLITTGSGFDAWTGSVRREVVDFQVATPSGPGLKWTRTYNSSNGDWSFSYSYAMAYRPYYNVEHMHHPDGRMSHFEVGSKERLFDAGSGWQKDNTSHGDVSVYLGDGSIVHFSRDSERYYEPGQTQTQPLITDSYLPLGMEDRYGHKVSFVWEPADQYNGRLSSVTDETGRWIKILYQADTSVFGYLFCPTLVYSSDGQWVKYTWATLPYASDGAKAATLVKAEHSDGTVDQYYYEGVDWGKSGGSRAPVLIWARDTRASTPMQNIYYQYDNRGRFQGQILGEHYLNADNSMGPMVSQLTSSTTDAQSTDAIQTETRGDGPQCTIRMQKLNQGKGPSFTTYKTDYMGNKEKFGYNGNFFVNSVTDRNQNTTNFNLEKIVGNPLSRIHPDGNHIDYTYTDSFYPYYLETIKDENGNTTIFHRNGANDAINRGMIKSINYPDGGSEAFTYNTLGQVTDHLRTNGAHEFAVYDDQQQAPYSATYGLILRKYEPTSKTSISAMGAGDPHTDYTYYLPTDPLPTWPSRIKQVTDPNGYRTTYVYDDGTKPLVSPTPTDAQGNALQRRGRGLVKTTTFVDDTHPGETPTYPNGTQKNFVYDDYGDKLTETDELGHSTTYEYDDYRRVTKATDALAHASTTDYTLPGTSSSYVHTSDAWGQKKTPPTAAAPTGIATTQTFDANLRVVSRSVAGATTWFQYDANGNQTSITDPRGTSNGDLNYTTVTTYDTRNRKTQTKSPAVTAGGQPVNEITQYGYDLANNVLTVTRPDSTQEVNTYDPMNRLQSHWDGDSTRITRFTYYTSGKMHTVTDANSHTTTFTYDPSDAKTQMLYHNGDHQDYLYDNNHNLVSRRTAAAALNVYQKGQYDARNRKIVMWWGSNPDYHVTNDDITSFATGIDRSTFHYDGAGRLTSAANNFSTVTRAYDNANKLLSDQQALAGGPTRMVQYEYDAANENTRMYINDGNAYDRTFQYDSMGRFSKILNTSNAQTWFTYTYDIASNVTHRLNNLNSIDQDYGPADALNRLAQRNLTFNGNRISALGAYEGYAYDKMNRLRSIIRDDGTDSFGYNNAGEMTGASYQWSNRSVTYNLDLVGNRNSVVDAGVTKTYLPDNINRYTTADSMPVGSGPQHQIGGFQNINYSYVADSYVAQITQPNASTTYTVAYDPLGRCVKRTMVIGSNNNTTYYVYDGEKPVLEYNATGTMLANNVYGKGIDEILLRYDTAVPAAQRPYFYQNDHEGSVTHLIDSTRTVLEIYRYDAFGSPTIADGNGTALTQPSGLPRSAFNNRFMFTGREYIQQFGIYEYRARTYHPGIGRFMSEDPKGFDAGDYNLFRYCKNDPEDLTDPMGLSPDAQPGMQGMPGPDPVVQKEKDASKQFDAAVGKYENIREDAKGTPSKDILRKGTEDAKQAVQDSKESPHPIKRNGTIQSRMEERGYSEFGDGKGGLKRAGPTIGKRTENDQPYVGLPYDKSGRPGITGAHSHVPGAAPGLDRDDRASALGQSPNRTGVPFVSFVGHTGDSGSRIVVFVPTGPNAGQTFHTYDGQSVYSGR